MPIILALMMNELHNSFMKRFSQTVTYAPHFISTVVLVSMMVAFLSPRDGLVNMIIVRLGGEPIYFMIEKSWFRPLFVASGVWQNMGWESIIYLAALAGVDPELYEAALMDGITKFKKIIYIDLPYLLPTAIILLIMNIGRIMTVGFEKTFLMQTDLTLAVSEVIQTYVYKRGLIDANFSFAAAVGLFNSVINCSLLIVVNRISRRVSKVSLW
jgi:putative aldouronate transport system permease protein